MFERKINNRDIKLQEPTITKGSESLTLGLFSPGPKSQLVRTKNFRTSLKPGTEFSTVLQFPENKD